MEEGTNQHAGSEAGPSEGISAPGVSQGSSAPDIPQVTSESITNDGAANLQVEEKEVGVGKRKKHGLPQDVPKHRAKKQKLNPPEDEVRALAHHV